MGLFGTYKTYLQNNPQHYWFRRKVWGWGWTPATWQGWVVTVAYLGAVIAFAFTLRNNPSPQDVAFTFMLPVALLTTVFLRIAYKKGESPKWQWGFPGEEE